MKKKFLTLLTTAVGIVALSACGSKKVEEITNVEDFNFPGAGYVDNDYFALKKLSYSMQVGESKNIVLDTFPLSYKDTSVKYTSLNPEIVTVNEKGVLTGVKKGYGEVEVASTKDESISSIVKVVVYEPSTKEEMQPVIDTIKAGYDDEGYKAPSKVLRYEYSEEYYCREGVREYGSESIEALGYSANDGYFFVEGPYMVYRVPGGSPEISNGKWLFYSINMGLYVRMIHITPTVKNYFDLESSSYGSNFDAAIRGILNCFFVSGEKIVNDVIDEYSGKQDFTDFTGFTSTKFNSVDDSSIYINYNESNDNQVVEADDEINYYNIPTDTVYSYVYSQDSYFRSQKCEFLNANMTMSYKLGNENWTRTFNRSHSYEGDFPIEKIQNPKDNGYKLVDTMYDL